MALFLGFLYNTQALLGIFAPFGTAKIYFRIKHHSSALAALQFRLIFEKLYNLTTAGTSHFKNIFRLPESLVLSGTPDH
jgi:hypothetical protein